MLIHTFFATLLLGMVIASYKVINDKKNKMSIREVTARESIFKISTNGMFGYVGENRDMLQ